MPANTLSYQLLQIAPAGAAIGSTGVDYLDADRSPGPGDYTANHRGDRQWDSQPERDQQLYGDGQRGEQRPGLGGAKQIGR